jgi:hypothetical protein
VSCDNFLHGFKGARSAPVPGRPPIWEAPREVALTLGAAQLLPVNGRAESGEPCRAGRRLPLLEAI